MGESSVGGQAETFVGGIALAAIRIAISCDQSTAWHARRLPGHGSVEGDGWWPPSVFLEAFRQKPDSLVFGGTRKTLICSAAPRLIPVSGI